MSTRQSSCIIRAASLLSWFLLLLIPLVQVLQHSQVLAFFPSSLILQHRHHHRKIQQLASPSKQEEHDDDDDDDTTNSNSNSNNNWIEIPLLDVLKTPEYRDTMIQPLPSAHLPDELSTCNVYGLQLTVPVFQQIVTHSLEQTTDRLLGHVAQYHDDSHDSNDNDDGNNPLLGAIGCTAQILYSAPTNQNAAASIVAGDSSSTTTSDNDNDTNIPSSAALTDQPTTVLCRGSFRFIVREITQTVPYTVALVEELLDDNNNNSDDAILLSTSKVVDNDEEDDDDEEDEYADLTPSQLVQRTLRAAHAFVDLQLEETAQPTELSPLEASLLEGGGILSQQQIAAAAERQAAQESAAVLEVFESGLDDLCATPQEQYFAVAFLAAELCNLDNDERRIILAMKNSLQRLRYVCRATEQAVSMARARRLAASITDDTDEASKELKVGKPALPPWARQIRKGTAIEYYWNEDWGWCAGEVVEDPVLVVDELILTVYFFDDESTQRLPFSGDEKVRWRPGT